MAPAAATPQDGCGCTGPPTGRRGASGPGGPASTGPAGGRTSASQPGPRGGSAHRAQATSGAGQPGREARQPGLGGLRQEAHVLAPGVQVVGGPAIRRPHGLPHEQPHGLHVVLEDTDTPGVNSVPVTVLGAPRLSHASLGEAEARAPAPRLRRGPSPTREKLPSAPTGTDPRPGCGLGTRGQRTSPLKVQTCGDTSIQFSLQELKVV